MKKLKNLFFVAAIMLCTTATQAQIKLGVQGAVDVNTTKFNSDAFKSSNTLGFQLGPTLDINIPIIGLGVEASALYGHKNKVEGTDNASSIESYDYISVPVNLKKSFSFTKLVGIYFYGGPYANIRVHGGDLTYQMVSDKYKSKAAEVGLNFGAGVKLMSHLALGVNYGVKLTDNYEINTPSVNDIFNKHQQTWSLKAIYFF